MNFLGQLKKYIILGFRLTFKAAGSQDNVYTTLANNIDVTVSNSYLYVSVFSPSAKTQAMFNESIKNIFTLSHESWDTDREVVNDGKVFEIDFGSAQNVNLPKFLVATPRLQVRIGISNKANNTAIFENLDVKKHFVEIEGQNYPKDFVSTIYAENERSDQNRDLKFFYTEYVGEELLKLILILKLSTLLNLLISDIRLIILPK